MYELRLLRLHRDPLVCAARQAAEGAKADYVWLALHLEESGSTDFVRLFVRVLKHEHALHLQRPPTWLQLLRHGSSYTPG
ncbi:hypothetical protein MRX96_048543 [Rhipicephalus microplus]